MGEKPGKVYGTVNRYNKCFLRRTSADAGVHINTIMYMTRVVSFGSILQ